MTSTTPATPATDQASLGARLRRDVLDRRWVLLVLLFGVTGALGIPLLWVSRGFGIGSKIVLTVVVTLYTAGLLWVTWLVLLWSWERISQATSGLNWLF